MLEGRIVLEGSAKDITRERVTEALFTVCSDRGYVKRMELGRAATSQRRIARWLLCRSLPEACNHSMFGVMRIINLASDACRGCTLFLMLRFAVRQRFRPFLLSIVVLPVLLRLSGSCCNVGCWNPACARARWYRCSQRPGSPLVLERRHCSNHFGADCRVAALPISATSPLKVRRSPGDIYVGFKNSPVLEIFPAGRYDAAGRVEVISDCHVCSARDIRAPAEDPDTAELCGINARSVLRSP